MFNTNPSWSDITDTAPLSYNFAAGKPVITWCFTWNASWQILDIRWYQQSPSADVDILSFASFPSLAKAKHIA